MIAKYSKELPVRHIGQPEELAEAVSILTALERDTLAHGTRTVPFRHEVHVYHGPGDLRRWWRTAGLIASRQ
jgi:hypothetical protein